MARTLTGRQVIYTDEDCITSDNVVDVLKSAMSIHMKNAEDIEYLYNMYKGEQDIRQKTKETRQNINNIIVENHAYEITTFKKGYIFGEPVQYIARGESKLVIDDIKRLNSHMVMCNKGSIDSKLADWMLIGGQAYRMTTINKKYEGSKYESLLKMRSLDPRKTFMVRFNDVDQEVAMAVTYKVEDNHNNIYSIYTNDKYFLVDDIHGLLQEEDLYGGIPFDEYILNDARLGCFEIVASLLNAINLLQSNRLDDVEQHINSFMAVFGAELDEQTYNQIQEWKMMVLPNGSDVKYLSATLNQGDVQKYKDDLYKTVLTICGMPSVESGSNGGGDNGVAVQLRNGWQSAETQAKAIENSFKASEIKMITRVLSIIDITEGTLLIPSDIEIKFPRRYTDNISTKAQTLMILLEAGIHPAIAIASCSIWNDPMDVYAQSKSYLSKWIVDEEEEEIDVL